MREVAGARLWSARGAPTRPLTRAGSVAAPERTSLIPHTLRELAQREAGAAPPGDAGQPQRGPTPGEAAAQAREERRRQRRSLEALGLPPFAAVVKEAGGTPLRRGEATTLQLNVGLYCNQACSHCHVEASPLRTREQMGRATAERCLALVGAGRGGIRTLDLTGGAPELNAQFRYLVQEGRRLGLEVIDRCNLTVLLEPGQEGLPQFLAEQQVRVVASLPCYSAENVDAQRGPSVFARSIQGLGLLNGAGFGVPGTGLALDLVYNPGGPFLAPPRESLEGAYRQELLEGHGVRFSRLLCLNNMPIKRYVDWLQRQGQLEAYMQLLVGSFSAGAAEGVMCRDTISVGWDGRIYDCDFNQQLGLGLQLPGRGAQAGAPLTVHELDSWEQLTGARIAVDAHCFGCTAGCGSGCQGGQPQTA